MAPYKYTQTYICNNNPWGSFYTSSKTYKLAQLTPSSVSNEAVKARIPAPPTIKLSKKQKSKIKNPHNSPDISTNINPKIINNKNS